MNGRFRRLQFDRQGPTPACIVWEILIHECLGACETDGASDVQKGSDASCCTWIAQLVPFACAEAQR